MLSKLSSKARGFTILEVTIVILILLTVTGVFFGTSGNINQWRTAQSAGLTLRQVEVAQRQFLADNPQVNIANVTQANVANYLSGVNVNLPPGTQPTLPQVLDLNGNVLSYDVTRSPPVFLVQGTTTIYDPEGNPNDGLWDVGK